LSEMGRHSIMEAAYVAIAVSRTKMWRTVARYGDLAAKHILIDR
jgi:hypothetical protein